MAQTNINIRMDEELKRQFEALCEELGLTMTAAITIFAKKTIRERGIPFEVSAVRSSRFNPYFSKSTHQAILDGVKELDAGGGTYHELIEIEDDEG